jgi:hypothetical protein
VQIVELEGGMLLCIKSMPTLVSEVVTDPVTKRMVAMVSTESVDSDGDIIHQGKNKKGAGWVLDRFNKSPLMTWMHDTYRPNIGAPEVRAKLGSGDNGKALYLDPFAFDVGDDFAMEIAGKYARGVLSETSVGFIGNVWDWMMKGDMPTGREYFEQELIEVAAVNRGANPDTTTAIKAGMMARMLVQPKVAKAIETGGDSELRELKQLIADMEDDFEARLTILSNEVKRFSDCNAREPVVSTRAQDEAAMVAVGKATLKRLAEVGLAGKA